jgi:hypothetical protein
MELTCEKEVLLVTSREKKPAANSTFINKQSKIHSFKTRSGPVGRPGTQPTRAWGQAGFK